MGNDSGKGKNGFWKEATICAKAHEQRCQAPEKVLEDKKRRSES